MPRYQVLRGTDVVNQTSFGRKLQAFGRRTETLRLFWKTGAECGFQDGGCLTFARALQDWSDGRLHLAALTSFRYNGDKLSVEHVVVTRRRVYLDSDGLASKAELICKAEQLENIDQVGVDGVYRISPKDALDAGVAYHEDAVQPLAALMRKRLGPYGDALLLR